MSQPARRIAAALAIGFLTIAAFVAVTFRFRLEPNIAALLPERGEAAALRRYVNGFGGGDLAVLMVEGKDADESAAVAAEVARELAKKPSVRVAADRIDASRSLDPMLAFRHADPRARARLEQALSPEGMRARLAESRAMLLAPGGGAAGEVIASDPLRLAQLVFEGADISSGVRTQPDGAFATDDGKVHLVLAQPKGQALRGADARAFVSDAEAVMEPIRRAHPGVFLGLTGGHAIAAATEAMLTRDLTVSGTLAMVLASVVFALIFRRFRALAAVMPPLALGTIWTAGLATVLPGGLSGIAVAFMSVVVGVGVDTGVHVYSALLEARRDGLSPSDAAHRARSRTSRAVLFAALTAAAAFAALALSDINAVRQLGILCASGELLTAVAILFVTPEVGAWLERGPPPPPEPARWTAYIAKLTGTRARAAAMAALAILPIPIVALGGGPPLAESIVAIRPKKLAPLEVQRRIFEAFGGKQGQWVVLVADPDLDRARARSDVVAERLSTMKGDVEAVDALTALAPSAATQAARFAARDALDMPAKALELERALRDIGFAPERFEGALAGMRSPARDSVALEDMRRGATSILITRYLGEEGGDHLVATYVRPTGSPGSMARVEQAIREADAGAMLTGYSRLEASLRETLSRDMPRIGLVAAGLVVLALAASLKRARDVALAALVVVAEVSAVLLLIRAFRIPLHAYDALVIPVLLGITVDEAMFLLHRARMEEGAGVSKIIEPTLRHEAPAITATALTTAAGFGALSFCDFDGLRDLGMVGALGSVVGLAVALIVVPAGLRLFARQSG